MQLSKAHQKAIKFVDKQNYNKALSEYHIALQSEPNNPDLYSQRGVVYLHLKQNICSVYMLMKNNHLL